MFDPLNLFKSVNCPYYNSISNTITCERPYCQFRHPPKQQSNAASKQEEHLSSEPVNNSKHILLIIYDFRKRNFFFNFLN
jgi:hypothetical protein